MGLSPYQRMVLQAGPVGYWPLYERGYARQVLAETPGGYWMMGEASGNLADSSGNGITATKHGAPTYGVTGPVSDGRTAIRFDGAADYFDLGNNFGFGGTTACSVIAWVKVAALQNDASPHGIAAYRFDDGSGAQGWEVAVRGAQQSSPGFLMFRRNLNNANDTVLSSAALPLDGAFHLVIATYDGTTMTLYLDGVVQTSTGSAKSLVVAAQTGSIGAYISGGVAGNWLAGTIGHVALISGRAITATEVTALYAARTQTDATVSAAAADLAPTPHTGTYTNGPALNQPAGVVGSLAARFNGATAYVSVPSAVTVTDSFTLEAWINPASIAPADTVTILSLDHGSTQLAMLTTGKLRFSANLTGSGQQNMNGLTTLTAAAWAHVVAVWSAAAGAMTLYLNGVQDKQVTGLTGPLSLPSTTRFIGQDNNAIPARFWNGSLSDVAVYNKALTAAQVAAQFAAGHFGYTGSRYRLGSRANWCY